MAGCGEGSSLASRVKLKKLTVVDTHRAVKVTTKASSSSEYFTSNCHGGEKLGSKRKRAAKTVPHASHSEKSYTPRHGSLTADSAKSARSSRRKRQTTETTAKEAARKETDKQGGVRQQAEMDLSVSSQLQSFPFTIQNSQESCSVAPEVSFDENHSTSSSDVEWEDVEGNHLFSCYTWVTWLKLARRKPQLADQ